MRVYRHRNSPFWQVDFIIDGHRFCKSTRVKIRRKAEQIAAAWYSEALKGRLKRKPRMTLKAACDHYWDHHGRFKKAAATYDYQLDFLLDRLGEGMFLDQIGKAEITGYIARRRGEVADSSVNREIELLRRVMNRAGRDLGAELGDGIIWTDHKLSEPVGRTRWLTDAEEQRLVEQLAHHNADLLPMLSFAIVSGARLDSVRRLTWSDVDFQGGAITLRSVKSDRPGEVHVLPLTKALAAILSSLRGIHPIYPFTYRCVRRSARRRPGERYPFSKTGWRRAWRKALAAAKIVDFRWHDLRHTAATRMLRASGNLAAVSRVLGHASVKTTMRYAHVLMEDMARVMEAGSRTGPEKRSGYRERGTRKRSESSA